MVEQDKIFKKTASEHESPIDFESLWNQLEPHVPSKTKRRPIFWFWLAGFAFIGFSAYLIIDPKSPTKPKVKSLEVVNIKQNDQIANTLKNDIPDPKLEQIKQHPKDKKTYFNVRTPINNVSLVKVKSKSADLISKDIDLTKETKYALETVDQSEIGNLNKINIHTELKSIGDVAPLNSLNSININNDEEKIKDLIHTEAKSQETILSLPNVNFVFLNAPSFFAPKIIVSKRKKINLLFRLGVGISNNKFHAPQLENDLDILLNTSEKSLEYLTIGIATDFAITNKWYIQTGLKYSRYSTHIIHESNNFSLITKNGVTEININPEGEATNIIGAVSSTKVTNKRSSWHTYHHSIDLPINIRYLILKANRHKLFIDGGVMLKCWSGSQGGFVNQSNHLQKFDFSSSPYNSLKLGLNGGMSWEWHLRSTGAFYAGLMYDKSDLRLTYNNNIINKSLSSLSMNLGYRIFFTP
ncbi:MAG: hypothetical protein IPN86_09030 [Saprospiraceae bacterium]|nr:hypothetical protein [Saprospiraceae bacterium]